MNYVSGGGGASSTSAVSKLRKSIGMMNNYNAPSAVYGPLAFKSGLYMAVAAQLFASAAAAPSTPSNSIGGRDSVVVLQRSEEPEGRVKPLWIWVRSLPLTSPDH
jgi:hypothetical protein